MIRPEIGEGKPEANGENEAQKRWDLEKKVIQWWWRLRKIVTES